MNTELHGRSLIGARRGSTTSQVFRAFDPKTGQAVGPDFYGATVEELNAACGLAGAARIPYGAAPQRERAVFLRKIVDNIEALGDALIERASLETGLPNARFVGERARTCGQLRMFADLLDDGSWVDARIDSADPDRQPLPKPDLRSMMRPIGPVTVFCASNFPLAYSVAGGDTASALAAGCPVVVNAHFAHPGTAELVGSAVRAAVEECGMPEGTFSLVFSTGYEIGQAFVKHPEIKAVGFTGSRAGGRALMDIAAARPEPITVYAEMSSVNPVFILPSALRERREAIASGLHGSVTQGAGQFCTKPGLVFIPGSEEAREFSGKFGELIQGTPAMPLLTSGIRQSYVGKSESRALPRTTSACAASGFDVDPQVFYTDSESFFGDPSLADEIFGPATLFITTGSREDLLRAAREMEGQLTATIHGTPEDLEEYRDLVAILETKAGRLIFNGFPTGVEVGHAIVHGGPYPATSDSRTSAVGTRAIWRFSRYVCYQNYPEAALPDELKESNPLGIKQMLDGKW